ncbi:unnamed protein product [Clonostachys rhizophaga]|uniref:Protein kinase domain-containing protein n=1 Tax=Clonostachys rhizophaga TaxID=160324 RepID=A0A9N9YLL5_9HYPO|nr:unnamed protein product [Clonostachys rhizophaga]
MEPSQNISVLRDLFSKCDRGYLMENLDSRGDYQTYVPVFSMLFNIAKYSDAKSLLNHGLDDGSLPWAVVLSGFKDPAEGKVVRSEFLDQQWGICFSLLELERDFSNLEFHKLSTFPFPKNIPILHLGKDIQSGIRMINFPKISYNYITERIECSNITSNELEHSRETLADIFADNKPPYEYQGIKYTWERVLGIISSIMAVHGHVKNLRIDYDITPTTILVSTDRGSGKDFFLDFNATNDGRGYEADKANTFAACHNRTYSRSSAFPRTYARGSDPRCLGAPESSFITMSNTEKCSSDDMWSLGCILLEISAFITYGHPGLHEFQKQREIEIASLHRSLGNLDDKCFHDSHGPLVSVQKFVQGIHRNGRRCDDITPRIADLALNRLLVPQKSRCTAFELFNKVDEAIEISKDV